jgi:hypothetical protein
MVIAFAMVYRGWTTGGATPPTGYTLAEGQTADSDLGVAYKAVAAAGTENPGAFTNAYPTNSDVVSITVALAPQAATKVNHRVISF